MPRRARHFVPNAIFHAGNRGVDRQPIFLGDADKRFFIEAMRESLSEDGCRSVAHCLIPNHFHWALATGELPFDSVFHRLQTRHAVHFNKLHGRTGHLFEDRHWSFHCSHLDRIEDVIAYIHMNPVRAGLVRHPSEWHWSSYAAWSGGDVGFTDIPRLAELSGRSVDSLLAGHAAKIESELATGPRGLQADALVSEVAALFGLSAGEIRAPARGELVTRTKRVLFERARREGIRIVDLAKSLNCEAKNLYALMDSGHP